MNITFMNFDEDETFKIKLNEYVILNLKKENNAWGVIYFTDEMGNTMNIPLDFYVCICNTINHKSQLRPNYIKQCFELSWMTNYTIFYKMENILNLKNQRVWEVTSPKDISIEPKTS
jgi:hypothetical protein